MSADPKSKFERFCGDRFGKFMESLYANEAGKIELKHWQEKLVTGFLSANPDLGLNTAQLLEKVRAGTERLYSCPEKGCRGNVGCSDHRQGHWACGECGEAWDSLPELLGAIEEAEARDLDDQDDY